MFLVAEYCRGPFYMGWHLYLRDHRELRRNTDGSWGWLRRVLEHPAVDFLSSVGITITGDGTCDYDGIAEFAKKYIVKGRRAGGKKRGCLAVHIDKFGNIEMANKSVQPTRGKPGC